MRKRVVITGIGALSPIGNNVNEFWNNLVAGKSGADIIRRFDPSRFKTQFACELKEYDPINYFEKSEARKYDAFVQYALIVAEEAIKMSQINLEKVDRTEFGVIWGSGNGGIQTFEEQMTEYIKGDGNPRFSPFFITKMIPNMAPGLISIKYGLQGINFATVSACATSNTAIIEAYNYIRWGQAKMIIAGGSEAAITPSSLGGFSSIKALSTRNDDPASASRPFAADRDGFVMGEGAGALILEEYEHAMQRNAIILAEVAGGAMTADAYHLTASHPEGDGAYRAMKKAMDDADLNPDQVDTINAHATSTPLGDISEIKAITRLFGENPKHLHISATKSMTGHLLGAAGAIEAIACVMAIKENIVPPTINTREVDPLIPNGINLTLGKSIQKNVNVAMSNTFGFGGHVASVILKKFK
jgi:3-oxoacyl-[acyl-carrier-protein] synthase II